MPTDLQDVLAEAAAKPQRPFDVPAAYSAARRRRRLKTGATVLAASLLVVAVVGTSVDRLRAPDVVLQAPGTEPGWSPLPESSLAPRYDHAATWTGEEMVIWGGRDRGEQYLSDGAAYNPATRSWRTLPAAPLEGRVEAVAAWTGKEVLLVGGWAAPAENVVAPPRRPNGQLLDPGGVSGTRFFKGGAAYDPSTDSWREMAPFPLAPRSDAAAAWTGRELLVWGGRTINTGSDRFFADGAAYDPAADSWRVLPAAPVGKRAGHASVWTGKEFIVFGGVASMNTFEAFTDGAAYNPRTDRWRSIAKGPSVQGNPGMHFNAAVWTDDQMLIWTGRKTAAFDPATDRWSRPAQDPFPGLERLPGPLSAVWTGTEMLTWGGWAEFRGGDSGPQSDGAAYNPATNAWTLLPEAPLGARDSHSQVWTGEQLLVWGGLTFDAGLFGSRPGSLNDGAAYVPAPG